MTRIKEKGSAKGKWTERVFKRKPYKEGLDYTVNWLTEGKEKVCFQNLDLLLPIRPIFPILNGRMICGIPAILVKGFLIARKLGIRIVYWKFSAPYSAASAVEHLRQDLPPTQPDFRQKGYLFPAPAGFP